MLSGSMLLQDLTRQMTGVAAKFSALSQPIGRPDLVKKAAERARKLFQETTGGIPSMQDAYAAALAFMRGEPLDYRQRHLLAGALNVRVRECGGKTPLEHPHLGRLLQSYEEEVLAGEMRRLMWFGLLSSYFAFDPIRANDAHTRGWEALRAFLQRTWPHVDAQTSGPLCPDWMKVLREDADLLTESAARRYARQFLRAHERLDGLRSDLGIPEASWFWHALVLEAVRVSTEQADEAFIADIPKLIALMKQHPAYRDQALEAILVRYHRCTDAPVNDELRNYAVDKTVWRNPKLRSAGLATSWNRVPDPVWRMALSWVNEHNLRAFFEILARRYNADEGRLAFWSRYLEQISWTRLIFSSETMELARRSADIRELLAAEDGAYATLWGYRGLDAFMMEIGGYLVVEFSTSGNAAYVYQTETLRFNRYARQYHGGKEDLRYGFDGDRALRIVHTSGWEVSAEQALKRIGIYPDPDRGGGPGAPSRPCATISRGGPGLAFAPNSREDGALQPSPSTTEEGRRTSVAPPGAPFTMAALHALLKSHPRAFIEDRRRPDGSGGRLWVHDPTQSRPLAKQLVDWGFRWSDKREGFYYPES